MFGRLKVAIVAMWCLDRALEAELWSPEYLRTRDDDDLVMFIRYVDTSGLF